MNGKFLLILLSLPPVLAFSQDRATRALTPDLVPIWQKHSVKVDGAINPSAIPYGVVMERVFVALHQEAKLGQEAFRQRLVTRITATSDDAQLIAQIAAESREFARTVRDNSSRHYDEICREILSTDLRTLNALSVAEQLEAVAIEQAARLTAHYKERVAALSAAARRGLEAYADTEVRPAIRWGHDLIGLANDVPLAFLSLRKESCGRNNNTAGRPHWQDQTAVQPVPSPSE